MIDFKSHERGFRHKRMTLPVRSLFDWVTQNRIMINPMYTYHRPWGKGIKTQFIESVLVGMPIPDFWCEENNYGELFVLEGSQHLECLIGFVRDEFRLQGMKLLQNLDGCNYTDLPFHYSSAFLGRTDIELRIVSYDTEPLLKYEFFKGINRDVYGFPTQAARNYAYEFLPRFLMDLRESCKGGLEFDANDRDYSKSSFKLAYDIDETFLLLISLLLLKHRAIGDVRGGYPDLLDAGMFFLHENHWDLHQVGDDIRGILAHISNEVGFKLRVVSTNSFSRARHDIGRTYNGYMEVGVDGLVFAFIQTLKGKPVSISKLVSPSHHLRKRALNVIYNELFGD
jgi:hypothetical protein